MNGDKCPVCGTEGFGNERIPMSKLDAGWLSIYSQKAEWWWCDACRDHWPVETEEE